jgi:flagellin-like protein
MNKRGVSPVIATVLLVLLTIVAVGILATFVVRFVNDNVKDSDECFKVLGKISFDEGSAYNCNYKNATGSRTGFSVRIDNDEIAAFKLILSQQGSANSYSIEQNSTSPYVRMLDANFTQNLDVPTRGGVRTYVANGLYERVEVNAVLKNGKVCDTRQKLEENTCVDQGIIDKLFSY